MNKTSEKASDESILLSFPNTAYHFSSNAVHMYRKLAWQTESIGNLSACLTVLSGARLRVCCRPARTAHLEPARTSNDGGSASVFAFIELLERDQLGCVFEHLALIKWTSPYFYGRATYYVFI